MKLFAYSRPSINCWSGWLTEPQYLMQLIIKAADGPAAATFDAEYKRFNAAAQRLAKQIGWDGDLQEGPFIAGLPAGKSNADGQVLIAWKQDDSTTFIVSPFRLNWLEDRPDNWIEGEAGT